MYVYLSNIGNGGRLGNQIFTIASTIGIARKLGFEPRFPDWPYRKYFNLPDEFFEPLVIVGNDYRREKHFHFDESLFEPSINGRPIILHNSYLQSYKYWQHCEDEIFEYLTPNEKIVFDWDTTGICFRRGDYVSNPNYANLQQNYYIAAWDKIQGFEWCVASDSKEYAEFYTRQSPNDEMIDFMALMGCDRHIVANSTFAWWAAYLSRSKNVIYPSQYFAGKLAETHSTKDFWPEHWQEMDINAKAKLKATFIIPVQYDHVQRLENCIAVVKYLQKHFDCEILIGEVNGNHFMGCIALGCKHIRFDMPHFHRTKVLNELTKMAENEIVFNWDADVFCSPWQIYWAYQELEAGADVVYPYDGTFYWCDRKPIKHILDHQNLDCLIGKKYQAVGATPDNPVSYGGALGYNREAFFKAGGENENFVSYGPEDQERWWRFNLLGLDVRRIDGPLYHIDHYRGKESSFAHSNGMANVKYWNRIKGFSKEQLQEHINGWTWQK